jgi:hypothetical protein
MPKHYVAEMAEIRWNAVVHVTTLNTRQDTTMATGMHKRGLYTRAVYRFSKSHMAMGSAYTYYVVGKP